MKKKRSLLFKILTPILIIILIIVIIFGVLFYLIYDGTSKNVDVDKSYNAEKLENEVIYNSFKDIKESKSINVNINNKMLNNLLYLATSSIKDQTKGTIKNSYVEIDNSSYNFYFEFSYSVVKTRLKLKTTLVEDKENKTIVFKIDDLHIGKISSGFLLDTGLKQVNNKQIDDLFSSIGLSIKADLTNKKLTYSYTDMFNDLEKLMNSNSSFTTNVSPLLSLIEENNLLAFTNNSDGFSFNLDLEKFTYNSELTSKTNYNIDLTNLNTNIETLLNNKVINQTTIDTTYKYLINGYSYLSNDEKQTVDKLDLTSINITDNSSYTGVYSRPSDANEKISTELLTNFTYDINNNKASTYLKEETINNLIESQDIVGKAYSYLVNVNDTYKNIYIAIDDIYTNILNDKLYFTADLNINGYVISFTDILKIDSFDAPTFTINFKTEDVYLGNIKANDEVVNLFFDYLNQATSSNSLISVNKDTKNISISFNNYLESKLSLPVIGEKSIKEVIKLMEENTGKTSKASLIGTSLDDKEAKIDLGIE